MKQQKPTTLDAAVSTTLEMESYLPQKGGPVGVASTELTQEQDISVAATSNESAPLMMKELLDCMRKLETDFQEIRQSTAATSHSRERQKPPRAYGRCSTVVCWKCNRPGHNARDCYAYFAQENERPRTN